MAFQSTVGLQQGFGVAGELATDAPHMAATYTLRSVSSALNIIGATAYTLDAEGIAKAGSSGSVGTYIGVLCDPKEHANFGVTGNTLGSSMVVPNESIAALLTMGQMWCVITTTAAIGDWVVFDNTSGALSTVAKGSALPVGKSWANAFVDRYTVTVAGLAFITFMPALAPPIAP